MNKKITDLTVTKKRTIEKRDQNGNLYRDYEDAEFVRDVNNAKTIIRLVNFLIDYAVYYGLVLLFWTGFFLIFKPEENENIDNILLLEPFINLAIYFLYYLVTEYFFGRSISKFITQCRIINEYCEKPTLGKIAIRSISRFVPFELFSAVFGAGGRMWHDSWSKTWVVSNKEFHDLKQLLNNTTFHEDILD